MTTHLNVEIKAKCSEPGKVKKYLLDHHAEYRGLDRQVDVYFNCPEGRLKLRKGNIENSLIFYNRDNKAGPKASEVNMVRFDSMVEVDKERTSILSRM